MNILLIKSNSNQTSEFERIFKELGCEISLTGDSSRGIQFMKNEAVHLVALDWRIPDAVALNLLHWIRANLGDEPLILFSAARTLEVDIAAVLNAGADTYIEKPIREIELMAQIKALLRRNVQKKCESIIEVEDYVMHPILRTVTLRGEAIDLTEKEFLLANCLFSNVGRVVSRDFLSMAAWGRVLDATSRSLDTHIYRLRKKLRLRPENGLQLSSVYTNGYRLDMTNDYSATKHTESSLSSPLRTGAIYEANRVQCIVRAHG